MRFEDEEVETHEATIPLRRRIADQRRQLKRANVACARLGMLLREAADSAIVAWQTIEAALVDESVADPDVREAVTASIKRLVEIRRGTPRRFFPPQQTTREMWLLVTPPTAQGIRLNPRI